MRSIHEAFEADTSRWCSRQSGTRKKSEHFWPVPPVTTW
jgi:hypothetical protein